MLNFRFDRLDDLTPETLAEQFAPFALKFNWFADRGYSPHLWQGLFHAMHDGSGKLLRYRHLVAGRRGGKTLSAAEEVLYYAANPAAYHWDAHREVSDAPLHIWVLTKDHVIGRAALLTFRKVLKDNGFAINKDYKEHRGMRYFEFENDTLVEFKTAEDPENLRGAGLHILWMDEAAFIPSDDAWLVVRPALSDTEGIVITTTTPRGKNWFYKEFWSPEAMANPRIGRVEYRSLDNPHFSRDEWEEMQRYYHPLMFKQEYMASFDSMQGVSLPGTWLHYYDKTELPKRGDSYDLTLYMGVDPAISVSKDANRFSAALIGVTRDHSQVYLLEQYAGHIPFPEQVELVTDWFAEYKPSLIGIESNAYQAALAQQLLRIEKLPPIMPVFARGKKMDRIIGMSPLFKLGRVKIRKDHRDFIDEWLAYDPDAKNPSDDCLDSMEIALRTAGALLPEAPKIEVFNSGPASSLDDLARRLRKTRGKSAIYDEHLGGEW